MAVTTMTSATGGCSYVFIPPPGDLRVGSAGSSENGCGIRKVHDHAVVTPLIGLAAASQKSGTEILLKCGHQQTTGSEAPGTAAWTGSAIPDAAVPVAGGDDHP
jgi:hypothetical protein